MRSEIILTAGIALLLLSCQPSKDSRQTPVRLGPEVTSLAEEMLSDIKGPVTLMITRGGEGETGGEEAQALVDLIDSLSPLVTARKLDIATHPDDVKSAVSSGPIIEIKGTAPGTLRYYGYPERKETRPFLEGVLTASGKPADLEPEVESFIRVLNEEVLIRIFTTPD